MCVCVQLSAMELRCRSVVSEKDTLEEKLGDMEREKKASEKKIQQVSERAVRALCGSSSG